MTKETLIQANDLYNKIIMLKAHLATFENCEVVHNEMPAYLSNIKGLEDAIIEISKDNHKNKCRIMNNLIASLEAEFSNL